jgi:hypothetical protein
MGSSDIADPTVSSGLIPHLTDLWAGNKILSGSHPIADIDERYSAVRDLLAKKSHSTLSWPI